VKRPTVCNPGHTRLPARRYTSTRNESAAFRAGASVDILYRLMPTKDHFLDKTIIGYLNRLVSRISADDPRPVIAEAFYGNGGERIPIVLPAWLNAQRPQECSWA
jgi:hypothetical protein